jgi:hypothetical protein
LPKFTDPASNWNLVTAEKIAGSTYVAEDGREIVRDWPLNLVRDAVQAGQVASYAMADSREAGPITLTLGAAWRFYKPGDCLRIESVEEGFNADCVILTSRYDPATLKTTFTLKTETPGKHPFALGKVAVPPPTPIVGQSPEERDQIAAGTINPVGAQRVLQFNPSFPITPGTNEIVIVSHTALITDGRVLTQPAETFTGLDDLTLYHIFWDLIAEEYLIVEGLAEAERGTRTLVDYGGYITFDGADPPPAPPSPPPGVIGGDPNVRLP